MGLIADEVKDLDPQNKYGLWVEKEDDKGEVVNYLHYNKILSFNGLWNPEIKK